MRYLMILMIVSASLISAIATAQSNPKGIRFTEAKNWQQVKELAKQQGRYIFVDLWTTWCPPCIMMNKEVFPSEAVGSFMNARFINFKLQLDTTAADSDAVKALYADAAAFSKRFNIRYYPTFLFFDPQGDPVHIGVGGSDAAGFLQLAKEAIDPKQQFFTLKGAYERGERDTTLLYHLSKAANRAAEDKLMKEVTRQYLDQQKDMFTARNLTMLRSITIHPKEKGFLFFAQNKEKIDAVLGRNSVIDHLSSVLRYSTLYSLFNDKSRKLISSPDWEAIRRQITVHIDDPTIIEEIVRALKERHTDELQGRTGHH